jgi:putative transposase
VRWGQIKESFTRGFLAAGGRGGPRNPSRRRHREQAVWQRRYHEHTCSDEDDLERHVNYLHWNPVKHGLVTRVADDPWSSFHRFVRGGTYDPNWGSDGDPCPDLDVAEPE